MKKILLHGFAGAVLLMLSTGCGKVVDKPKSDTKVVSEKKAATATEAESSSNSHQGCGNHTSSGGGTGH